MHLKSNFMNAFIHKSFEVLQYFPTALFLSRKFAKGPICVRPKKVCVAPFRYSFIITRHMQTMMILQQVKVS